MANYVLAKGFKVDASAVAANFKFARFCKLLASDTKGQTVTSITTANEFGIGVIQDTLDASKITTGEATVGVQVLGIARCEAGAAVTMGARVGLDNVGRVVAAGTAVANFVVGVALNAAAAAGDHIEVLLTPGTTGSGT